MSGFKIYPKSHPCNKMADILHLNSRIRLQHENS